MTLTPADPPFADGEGEVAARARERVNVLEMSVDEDEVEQLVARYRRLRWRDSTRRAYRTDMALFVAWCQAASRQALPASPETVAGFISALGDKGAAVSSIERKLSAIATIHRECDLANPCRTPHVAEVLAGVRDEHDRRPDKRASLLASDLRRMLAVLDLERPGGLRDAALLAVGFVVAARGSELAALTGADVRRVEAGFEVRVERRKTSRRRDQSEEDKWKPVPWGSPAAGGGHRMAAWMDRAGISPGDAVPLWPSIDRHGRVRGRAISSKDVSRVIKRTAERAGMDPSQLASHSLRRGHATQAALAGTPERAIMRQGDWTDQRTLRGYIDEASRWDGTSANSLGL
jgi:site-specific recombinase XerD